MATFFTSEKFAYNNALTLKLIFANSEIGQANSVGYFFIGNHLPYPTENTPEFAVEDIYDASFYDRKVWNNMFAAKKITENNVELVIPRLTYSNTQPTIYRQYDDRIELSELLTANASQNLKPMYVINSEGNVYKCLSNNNGSYSTTEPTGDYTVNESGNIFISEDGYLWKYMYKVYPENKFQTTEWIPVPITTSKQGYNASNTVCVDGEITTVQVLNSGSGYSSTLFRVDSFSPANRTLTINLSTTPNLNLSNIVSGMAIEGPGIIGDVYIASINVVNKQIVLSANTYDYGGGTANTYNVYTRVVISGDGSGFDGSDSAICEPIIVDGSIERIDVIEDGINYNYANVSIFGTGTGANARAIISPKYGHGYNAAKELGSRNVMISMDFGESGDASEGNLISQFTTYRQYGILLNPHKYSESTSVSYQNANSVISQTYDVDLLTGPQYDLNEFVYQGVSPASSIFSGYVNARIDNTGLKLTNVKGKLSNTALLKSASVPTGRQISGGKPGEFEPYTGDILHVENVVKIERNEGQTENIKLIVKF